MPSSHDNDNRPAATVRMIPLMGTLYVDEDRFERAQVVELLPVPIEDLRRRPREGDLVRFPNDPREP